MYWSFRLAHYPFLNDIPPINPANPSAPVPALAGAVLFAIGGLLVMRRAKVGRSLRE